MHALPRAHVPVFARPLAARPTHISRLVNMESMFASWQHCKMCPDPNTSFIREHQHRTLHGWLFKYCNCHLLLKPH